MAIDLLGLSQVGSELELTLGYSKGWNGAQLDHIAEVVQSLSRVIP
jgi:hypothetical protein